MPIVQPIIKRQILRLGSPLLQSYFSTLIDCQFYAPIIHYTKKSGTSHTDQSCASASVPNDEPVTVKGLSSSEISHFTNRPLDRFLRITIEIQAPCQGRSRASDSGQGLRLANFFTDLLFHQGAGTSDHSN